MSDIVHRRSPVLNTMVIWGLVLDLDRCRWLSRSFGPCGGLSKSRAISFPRRTGPTRFTGVRTHIETGSMFTGRVIMARGSLKSFGLLH